MDLKSLQRNVQIYIINFKEEPYDWKTNLSLRSINHLVMRVLFSFVSILWITPFGDCTRHQNQETTPTYPSPKPTLTQPWMQGCHYGKELIYYRPIFRLTKLAFLRARARREKKSFNGFKILKFKIYISG